MIKRGEKGFTLIEIVIAVAVLGIAMAAVIKGISENLANISHLREKTFATWVAANTLKEMEINQAWSDGGRQTGESVMSGYTFYWRWQMEKTENENLRRLTVTVYSDEDRENQLTSLEGLLSNPAYRAGGNGIQ